MTDFVVVIPSRYASIRLPGKPLREINGKTMLEHVWNRGTESGAREVVVATDDSRIAEAAESFCAVACMTSDQHQSGTDRIAEVADILDWGDDTIVVNLQGDEPAMPPVLIDECASLLSDSGTDIGTLASPLKSREDYENSNVVKVVTDGSGFALYFSRSPIPYGRGEVQKETAWQLALHHHGIYAYRCGVLRKLVDADVSPLEEAEHLEQLRALHLGMRIKVGIPSTRPGAGVDTEEDLESIARELAS